MRLWALPLLAMLNLGLLGWLASMWFTRDGQLAGVHWRQPEPLKPTLDGDNSLPPTGVDMGRYVATLERPLFSPSRRPPPPPPVASAPPVVDTPPDIRVLGLYESRSEGGGAGGMVARVDGQVKRVKVGDSIGRWTLKEIRPGEAVLAAGDAQQVYPLLRSAATEAPPSKVSDNAAPAGGGAVTRSGTVDPARQRQIEEARANVRRMNVLRARSGMPPLPEP